MHIEKSIFRAYDIRGVVDKYLNDEVVEAIGLAIGTYSIKKGESHFVVGRDCRLSSNNISSNLIKGLVKSGAFVVDIGEVVTPMLYFAHKTTKAKSAVMITASHNPRQYNGFKIIINDQTIFGNQIKEIYHIIKNKSFIYGCGSVMKADIKKSYFDAVSKNIKPIDKTKVVVDCGNAVAGKFVSELYKKIGCEVVGIFCDIDGRFPNHHPDPTKLENLVDLKDRVKRENAVLGIAFDGDGDRVGIVDSKGDMILPDHFMMLFVKDILQKNPKSRFIYDVKCSQALIDYTIKNGGQYLISRCGHSFIKDKILSEKAIFAGEMSGHLFFNDRWYGFDDALYAGCRLIEIIGNKDSYNLFVQLPKYFNTGELVVDLENIKKVDNTMLVLEKNLPMDADKVIRIDGIKLYYGNSWGLVRKSNTTPSIIMRFEANNEEKLQNIKKIFKKWFAKSMVDIVLIDSID